MFFYESNIYLKCTTVITLNLLFWKGPYLWCCAGEFSNWNIAEFDIKLIMLNLHLVVLCWFMIYTQCCYIDHNAINEALYVDNKEWPFAIYITYYPSIDRQIETSLSFYIQQNHAKVTQLLYLFNICFAKYIPWAICIDTQLCFVIYSNNESKELGRTKSSKTKVLLLSAFSGKLKCYKNVITCWRSCLPNLITYTLPILVHTKVL